MNPEVTPSTPDARAAADTVQSSGDPSRVQSRALTPEEVRLLLRALPEIARSAEPRTAPAPLQLGSGVHRFFCPQCRIERRTRMDIREFSWLRTVRWLLVSGALAAAVWPWWQERAVVVALPTWIGFELVFRLRRRAALRCGHCGFDPILYRRDRRLARREVEEFWKDRLTAREAER